MDNWWKIYTVQKHACVRCAVLQKIRSNFTRQNTSPLPLGGGGPTLLPSPSWEWVPRVSRLSSPNCQETVLAQQLVSLLIPGLGNWIGFACCWWSLWDTKQGKEDVEKTRGGRPSCFSSTEFSNGLSCIISSDSPNGIRGFANLGRESELEIHGPEQSWEVHELVPLKRGGRQPLGWANWKTGKLHPKSLWRSGFLSFISLGLCCYSIL